VPEISIADLPALNAGLNGVAATLLVAGYLLIRRRRIRAHKAAMLGAFAASVLFLTSYLLYHWYAGSRPYAGHGPLRIVYFAVLISHIVLAAAIPPLAGLTLWWALRGRYDRHVPLARWTLPLWLYVSVTGIVVYWMLYH
jgi:putative membrane protein